MPVLQMIDLTGSCFGRWTVTGYAHGNAANRYWHCRCECGNTGVIQAGSLKHGTSKSCGCLLDEIRAKRKATKLPALMYGYIDHWNRKDETNTLIEQVSDVLRDYDDQKPLTVRQIYYILIGRRLYDKGKSFEDKLYIAVRRARRARLIDFEDVRDDGDQSAGGGGYINAADYVECIKDEIDDFRLNKWQGQKATVIVRCEAAGMVPQLATAVAEWSIPVSSGGGFDSVTSKWELAQMLGRKRRDGVILHIGDYDTHGLRIYDALIGDVAAFVKADFGIKVTGERVAITPEQIKRLKIEPERSIKNGKRIETVQAEAMAPDELVRLVRAAVVKHLDKKAFVGVLAREEVERAKLAKAFNKLKL